MRPSFDNRVVEDTGRLGRACLLLVVAAFCAAVLPAPSTRIRIRLASDG